MSDDVFEAFGDDDIFSEDEEELKNAEGEGQNRTFIIAVAVLGGLLVCALISFGVWALVLNRPQEAQSRVGDIVASPTVEAVVEATATPKPPAATDTPMPTDTPEPTPLLGPTATPTADEEADPDTSAVAEAPEEVTPTATQAPRRRPTPTRTPRPTATTRASNPDTSLGASSGQLSETGLGEWILIGAAVILVAVIVTARRLRRA